MRLNSDRLFRAAYSIRRKIDSTAIKKRRLIPLPAGETSRSTAARCFGNKSQLCPLPTAGMVLNRYSLGDIMPHARHAAFSDLDSLLNLFEHAPFSRHVTPIEAARKIWTQTLNHEGVEVFVSDEDSRIVATCMLITVPNLLREGRKHGFLENVVTHNDYLGRGHGISVVQAALEAAWIQGCFHVMLQSGRKESHIHRFYERQGFVGNLRVGYVARCPEGR